MTELRFVLVVNENRRLHLPEGIPFNAGDPLHVLWDGNVLQISRTKPKKLSDAYAKVQKDASRVLETDELAKRLAEDEARRRRKFDELFGGLPKQDNGNSSASARFRHQFMQPTRHPNSPSLGDTRVVLIPCSRRRPPGHRRGLRPGAFRRRARVTLADVDASAAAGRGPRHALDRPAHRRSQPDRRGRSRSRQSAIQGHDVALNAVPYYHNLDLTHAAIDCASLLRPGRQHGHRAPDSTPWTRKLEPPACASSPTAAWGRAWATRWRSTPWACSTRPEHVTIYDAGLPQAA